MLQATRRTGEQGFTRLQHSHRLSASLLSRQCQRQHHGLAGYFAPALLLSAKAQSRNISTLRTRRDGTLQTGNGPHQLRFQSTETQKDSRRSSGAAGQLPPDLASSKREKDNSESTSSSQTTSTTHDRDGIATEKESSSSEKKASSASSQASTPAKASSSSTTVSKPKEPLLTRVWAKVKHEASHYWSGTKLLGKEIKISARLQMKLLRGKVLTRREKRQVRGNRRRTLAPTSY